MSRIDQDISSSPLAHSKHPAVPPPPYREFATESGPSSLASTPSPALGPLPPRTQYVQPPQIPIGVPMAMPHHAFMGYGPTPLATNQPSLPYAYYESRGSADARAKWRFIHAFVLAIALWLMFGFVIGVEVWYNENWEGWAGSERVWS